jgi:hypothetical protein
MKYFFLSLFVVAFTANAKNSVSSQAFQVNVRPILNGIINDFYQMIVLFPDVPRGLVEIIDELDHMKEIQKGLLNDCPRLMEKKCLTGVDELRSRLKKLSTMHFHLLRSLDHSQSLHMTELSGKRVLGDFQECLESLKGKLDNVAFMVKADVPNKQETFPLIKQVDELDTYMSLALVEFIPYLYKEDFRHFFFSFVHPIQLQLGKPQNYEFLNRNVTNLNFAINLLNMNLTKRNKKTPEGMGPYLSTIHNRWNSILRYYF